MGQAVQVFDEVSSKVPAAQTEQTLAAEQAVQFERLQVTQALLIREFPEAQAEQVTVVVVVVPLVEVVAEQAEQLLIYDEHKVQTGLPWELEVK